MMFNSRRLLFTVLGCGLVLTPAAGLWAKQKHAAPANDQAQGAASDQDSNPLDRPLTDQERYKEQKELRQELKGPYKTWLNEEVPYIITGEERRAFLSLSNDEEREAFIENFWQRRNPDPNSLENTFREEHYRRIQYANDHFAAGTPGWRTDRGRIYIMWGPPDSIDTHPAGGEYQRPLDEGGGETSAFPYETWHYNYLPGVGENINIEFVDTCQCGDYHYTMDPTEKDAMKHVPGAFTSQYEQMSRTSIHNGRGEQGEAGIMGDPLPGKEFERISLAAKLFAPPPVEFKDLDSYISEHKVLTGPPFPFDVRTDYVRVTDSMDMVPITIQLRNRDITFVTKDGVSKGVVNILGKVTTIMHKTVQTFEDTVQVEEPSELLEKALDRKSLYWKALPLQPGLYRLDIAIKDVNNPDHVGIYGRALNVPMYEDDKVGASSLILADEMNTVSSRQIGSGNFIISDMFIRPRVASNPTAPVSFKRDQDLNFWMQFYNLGIDDATKSNSATVTYQITNAAGEVMLQKQLESKDLGAHSDELTVDKTLNIAGLEPGKYKVTVKVDDAISKQEVAQSAPFIVE